MVIGVFAHVAVAHAEPVPPSEEAPNPPAETPTPPELEAKPKPEGIRISGYLQSQYEHHQDSEDQLRPGGATLNQDRFLIRRARLKAAREWDYSSFMIELDGNTGSGPTLRLYRAEASLHWRGDQPSSAAPLVKATVGLFDVPFGYELLESSRSRFFMERSRASRAFFPSAPDVGARLSGELGFFRYAVAIQNGEPIGTKSGFPAQDPNAAKDIAGRVGAFVEPIADFEVSGGLSMLKGKGFHKGTDATKGSVTWKDLNEDGQIQNGELQGVPGVAATPSQNFDRWLVGADLQLRWKTKLGTTQVYGEIQAGSNMDRGLFVADPVATSIDVRELGYYVGVVQDVTRYGVVGFRYDYYDPNADIFSRQGGKLVPGTQRIHTFSPMVGLVLPGRARLIFQYDFINDRMGMDARGVPTDLANDTWTLRLQVES